eukprot:1193328-Prorocentrum_minimum.AAC.1
MKRGPKSMKMPSGADDACAWSNSPGTGVNSLGDGVNGLMGELRTSGVRRCLGGLPRIGMGARGGNHWEVYARKQTMWILEESRQLCNACVRRGGIRAVTRVRVTCLTESIQPAVKRPRAPKIAR